MRNEIRFGATNRGTKACEFCGVLSWAARQDETANRAMCQACYDSAGYENEHQDGYHNDRYEPKCPTCNPAGEERRLAAAAKRVASYGAAAAKRAEKAQTREAAAAAKKAATKWCQATQGIYRQSQRIGSEPCDQRAPASSDYCSVHRSDYPHQYKRGGPSFARRYAHIDRKYWRYPDEDQAALCGVCGAPQSDQLHEEAK
jgi:hypothetical protein